MYASCFTRTERPWVYESTQALFNLHRYRLEMTIIYAREGCYMTYTRAFAFIRRALRNQLPSFDTFRCSHSIQLINHLSSAGSPSHSHQFGLKTGVSSV